MGDQSTSSEPDVRFGVQLPNIDGLRTGDVPVALAARTAETLGFDNAWLGDHLVLRAPVVDSIVAAATALAVTTRLPVGFGVLVPALRQPAWLAAQLASLQYLSAGRLILGVGVGGEFPSEWDAAGVPLGERGQRTDALLDALPALFARQPVEIAEPFGVTVPPLGPQATVPPIWIGGRSDIALRRAVRVGGGWTAVWAGPSHVRAARQRLDELAGAGPRAPIAVQLLINPHPDVDRARAELRGYMEGIYDIPFDLIDRYTLAGPTDEIVERMVEIVTAGADQVVLMPGSPRPVADLYGFAELAAATRTALRQTRRRKPTTVSEH